MRKPPAQQQSMAVVVQTEAGRKTNGPVGGKIPRDHGRDIVRRAVQPRTLCVAQTSVHFHSGNEVLWTEIAAVG